MGFVLKIIVITQYICLPGLLNKGYLYAVPNAPYLKVENAFILWYLQISPWIFITLAIVVELLMLVIDIQDEGGCKYEQAINKY